LEWSTRTLAGPGAPIATIKARSQAEGDILAALRKLKSHARHLNADEERQLPPVIVIAVVCTFLMIR
jgi:hypothetical protein